MRAGVAVQLGDNRHRQRGDGIGNRHRIQPGDALRQRGPAQVVGYISAPDGEHRVRAGGAGDSGHGDIIAQRQFSAAIAQLGGNRSGDGGRRAAGRNGDSGLRRRNPGVNVAVRDKRPSGTGDGTG